MVIIPVFYGNIMKIEDFEGKVALNDNITVIEIEDSDRMVAAMIT